MWARLGTAVSLAFAALAGARETILGIEVGLVDAPQVSEGQSANSTLLKFLQEAQHHAEKVFGKDFEGDVHVALTAEVADVDSVAAALSYAMLQSAMNMGNPLVLPVINVHRDQLHLRTELQEVLHFAGVDESLLLCISDLPAPRGQSVQPLERFAREGRLRLALIDHNELAPGQAYMHRSVVAIVDHHRDTGRYMFLVQPENRRIFFPLGATSTVLYEMLRESDKVGSDFLEDRSLRLLLASAVLADTQSLQGSSTTDRDRTALRELVSGAQDPPLWPEGQTQEEYYDHLLVLAEEKSATLDMFALLKRDARHSNAGTETFSVSNIKITMERLGINSPAAVKAVLGEARSYMQAENLRSAFAIFNGIGHKYLLACAPRSRWPMFGDALTEWLERGGDYGGLTLRGMPGSWPTGELQEVAEGVGGALFQIGAAAGREHVLPFLEDFFSNVSAVGTVQTYLQEVLSELPYVRDAASTVQVHAFLTDETADLDSIASAVGLAFLEARQGGTAGQVVLPVINVPRAFLHVRRAAKEALRRAGVPLKTLPCLDEVPLAALAEAGRLKLTLVSHSQVHPHQVSLAKAVVGFVDRLEEPSERPAATSTLVLERMQMAGTLGLALLGDRSIGQMLTLSVLLQSRNLWDSDTSERDRAASRIFLTRQGDDLFFGRPDHQDKFVASLQDMRQDFSGLSFVEVMMGDLRHAQAGRNLFAVASVPSTIEAQLGNESLQQQAMEDLGALLQANKLRSVYAVLLGATFARTHLLACAPHTRWKKLRKSLSAALEKGASHGGITLDGRTARWPGGNIELAHGDLRAEVFTLHGSVGQDQVLLYMQELLAKGGGDGEEQKPSPGGEEGTGSFPLWIVAVVSAVGVFVGLTLTMRKPGRLELSEPRERVETEEGGVELAS